MTSGSFPLEGTGDLPNVTVAFPGEHWSDAVASGAAITPGAAVVLCASGETLAVRNARVDDTEPRILLALRPVDVPDAEHPRALGPNEIRNQSIAVGEYVHRYKSGVFHLTLVDPNRSYHVADLIGWDVDGARPSGKSGSGSWAPNANADIDSVFEVQKVREYGSNGEVLLTVAFANRGQF